MEIADLGNEKEPIYFVQPNTSIVIHRMIYTNLPWKKNRQYGPTWIRILQYLARIAVAMGPDPTSKLTSEQLNSKIDEATHYFLRQKEVL